MNKRIQPLLSALVILNIITSISLIVYWIFMFAIDINENSIGEWILSIQYILNIVPCVIQALIWFSLWIIVTLIFSNHAREKFYEVGPSAINKYSQTPSAIALLALVVLVITIWVPFVTTSISIYLNHRITKTTKEQPTPES